MNNQQDRANSPSAIAKDDRPDAILLVMFGLPGAGKTYVARQFLRRGFYVHDGDDDLPADMRQAIARAQPVTSDMRDRFMKAVRDHTHELCKMHRRLVVAQTFLKQIHRDAFLMHFPHARFVLVTADQNLRVARLAQRTNQPLEPSYAHAMVTAFDEPGTKVSEPNEAFIERPWRRYSTINNNGDQAAVEQQIDQLSRGVEG